LGTHQYRVEADGSRVDVQSSRLGQFEYSLTCFGRRFNVVSVVQSLSYLIEVDGVAHRIHRDDGGVVRAPAPAVVVSIAVTPGALVSAGERLAVLEAMKMEMPVVAPFSGKVRQVMAIPNVQVDTGAALLQIDPVASGDTVASSKRVVFGTSVAPNGNKEAAQSIGRQSLDDLRQLMLGFDVDPKHTVRLVAEWSQNCPVDS